MLALQGTGGGLDPIGCRLLLESLGGQSQVGGAVLFLGYVLMIVVVVLFVVCRWHLEV